MPCAEAVPGEPIFEKSTSSAFASTDLEAHLKANGITDLVVTGAVAGFCVNSTVRAGSDLGLNMTVVTDAVLGFELAQDAPSAQTIFDATMALLDGEFATLAQSSDLVG